jgi:membrane dipeptidase
MPDASDPLSLVLPVLVLGLAVLAVAGCGADPSVEPNRSLAERADSLTRAHLVVDGHVDLPYRLMEYRQNVGDSTFGDVDYPRAKAGGLDSPFMSIYIPVELQDSAGAAKTRADSLIDLVETIEAQNPDKFEVATSPDDVERIAAAGKIALPMGMENGAGLEDDLANVEYFFDRGIRYITLTHATHNRIGDASYDTTAARWGGLSPFGEDVVAEMNRLGMMVDISHVTDSTAYDVLDVTSKPVIASHSSCRHFTPGWERNLSDDLIRAIAENGGVVMINFGSSFLREDYQDANEPVRERIQAHIDERGWAKNDIRAVAYADSVRKANPIGTVSDVADHIDHVVNLVGIEHVGLGSDYDGVFSLPRDLQDASTYPNLVEELLRRQYSDADIAKILGGNALRVWRENER